MIEEQKKERVVSIIENLKKGFKHRFKKDVDKDILLSYIYYAISEAEAAFIKEALGHLYIRSSYDPSDLYMAIEVVDPKKPELKLAPEPTVVPLQEKRGRGRPKQSSPE